MIKDFYDLSLKFIEFYRIELITTILSMIYVDFIGHWNFEIFYIVFAGFLKPQKMFANKLEI